MTNLSFPRAAAALLLSASIAACATVNPYGEDLSTRLQNHVTVLASDEFEGRDTGEPGFDKAAEYVSTFYAASDIDPAAPGYRQPVPLHRVNPSSIEGELTIVSKGSEIDLIEGETVAFYPPSDGMGEEYSAAASGGIVFVGDGIVAPELGLNAYEGVDVEGKIVMMFQGAPQIDDNPSSVHLRRFDTKRMEAEKRGAVGILYLDATDRAIARFARFTNSDSPGQITLGAGFDTPMPVALLGLEAAAKLIEDAGYDFDSVVEKVKAGEAESFELDATAMLQTSASSEPVNAYNVVGVIPGTDPDLRDEAVVLTAHLDHVGMCPDDDPETDDIYNGALDNATGTAIIMEAAARIAKEGGNARTVIVAALTGEEKGLLGAAHLARNVEELGYTPVANVNIDMPVLVYPLDSIIAFGMEYSSLEQPFKAAADEVDLFASPDPVPQMSLFVRSDHYRFVQQGIPSLFLFSGMEGENLQNFQTFMSTHYHKPSDDLNLPINWQDAAKFSDLTFGLVTRIANDPVRPTWNEGVVFAPDEPQG
ncbi:M28 family peptidase [Parvularcula lutaonensis]|uniref:M28 family peptidase n=1 Tax=Parvularcula lutaonensis TaxID=491923 RepID=A0ABV7ME13_9PROT|nr:M28 family peptidase [Parvularcula lutaonensis]GGY53920.1 aminopeptidase [Parvularcula lutaonensis]